MRASTASGPVDRAPHAPDAAPTVRTAARHEVWISGWFTPSHPHTVHPPGVPLKQVPQLPRGIQWPAPRQKP